MWKVLEAMFKKTFGGKERLNSSPIKPRDREHRGPSHVRSVKPSLIVGYGMVLVLLLFTGYMAVKKIEDAREKTDLITNNYSLSVRLLSKMQADVSLIGLVTRDALLDSEPRPVSYYEDQLREIKLRIDDASREYSLIATLQGEIESWPKLREEIKEYAKVAAQVLALHEERRSSEAGKLLSNMVPKKERLFKIASHLVSLNEQAAEQEEKSLAEIYNDFRKNIVVITSVCLALGILVAFLASKHIMRLQRELLRQYQKDLESQAHLRKLSARLVTMQEEERRTIARELHDEVGQMLTAIKVNLRTIENKLPPSEKHVHERLCETRAFAEQTLQSVRELSQILRPPMLDDFGLVSTVQWYIDRFSQRTGVDVQFTALDLEERLSGELETHLYRIVQEALANIAKHAQASRVRISIRRLPSALELSIDDDGKGFEVKRAFHGGGSGLIGMRERIAQLGGAFRIDSRPGGGTHIYVEIPLVNNDVGPLSESQT